MKKYISEHDKKLLEKILKLLNERGNK